MAFCAVIVTKSINKEIKSSKNPHGQMTLECKSCESFMNIFNLCIFVQNYEVCVKAFNPLFGSSKQHFVVVKQLNHCFINGLLMV